MMVYSQVSKDSIDRAVEKAKRVKPRVRPIAFGRFQVSSSKGGSYEVTFFKENGEFVASCGCKGNENGNACYHVAACSSVFKLQVNERARCSTCGDEYVYRDGLCWKCWIANFQYAGTATQSLEWAGETYDLATMSLEAMNALWQDVCTWACDVTERRVLGTIPSEQAERELEDCRRASFHLTCEFERRGE